MKKLLYITLILSSLLGSHSLSAQMDFVGARFSMRATEVQLMNVDNAIKNKGENEENLRHSTVNLRFTLNAAQRSKNMKNFIAEVAKVSPEYAPQLAAELGNGAAFGAYAQRLESIGLDPNNVSDNFAAWWLTAWEASAGRPIDVPESAFGLVKAQVDRMLNNPQIAALSNADKQKMSDDMIVRTLIMANQIDQAKANPEFARQLAEGTKKSTKASGLDLDAMTLTPEGFRPKGKKRGDASDAGADMPGAVPSSQLAANAEATPPAGATGEGWSAGTVALIAAAGGLGAAGVFAMGKASGGKKG